MSDPQTDRRMLLVTADRALGQRGERVAAAARHEVVRAAPRNLAATWEAVGVVLVGVDQLAEVVAIDPPRRAEVFVIAGDAVPDNAWRDCVALGASDALALDESEGWLVERLSLRRRERAPGSVIAVCGAAGGVGTSVLCTGLAIAAADDGPSVVIDTDVRAGWLDLLLGVEPGGVGWAELAGLRGRIDGDALAATIPSNAGISLLSAHRDGPLVSIGADALRAAALAAAGLGGTVVIDAPADGPLAEHAVALADVQVIATTSDLRGGLAARRLLEVMAANREKRSGRSMIVAARTPKRGAIATAAFVDLVDLADDICWLPEITKLTRRVSSGIAAIDRSDRFVRECSTLLRATQRLSTLESVGS